MFFDHYNPEDLEKIIETQRKVVQYMKDHKKKKALSDFNFGGWLCGWPQLQPKLKTFTQFVYQGATLND